MLTIDENVKSEIGLLNLRNIDHNPTLIQNRGNQSRDILALVLVCFVKVHISPCKYTTANP